MSDIDYAKIVKDAIDDNIYNSQEEEPREHLGASMIGRPCEREIWYGWRWAKFPKHSPRMVRLFNRGHLEELRFEKWVAKIADKFFPLDPRTGKQIRISSFDGHFGGSADGVVVDPAGIKGTFLTEFKTHNLKSFEKLILNGVKKAKPEHYTQMQIYLFFKPKLNGAFYFAINKNDDSLHVEYVERAESWALMNLDKAKRILSAENAPPRHNKASKWDFTCKFCDFFDICHEDAKPRKSCRTCAFAEPNERGWVCTKTDAVLDKKDQMAGCKDYERLF